MSSRCLPHASLKSYRESPDESLLAFAASSLMRLLVSSFSASNCRSKSAATNRRQHRIMHTNTITRKAGGKRYMT